MTDTDATEKANEGGQGLTEKGCGIECRCLSMPCVNGLRHRMPLPSEVKVGPAAAKCEDHSSSDCIALTGLPTAWEGDSTAPSATRELDEDAAKNGGSQKRSPARSSQTLEEDAMKDRRRRCKERRKPKTITSYKVFSGTKVDAWRKPKTITSSEFRDIGRGCPKRLPARCQSLQQLRCYPWRKE